MSAQFRLCNFFSISRLNHSGLLSLPRYSLLGVQYWVGTQSCRLQEFMAFGGYTTVFAPGSCISKAWCNRRYILVGRCSWKALSINGYFCIIYCKPLFGAIFYRLEFLTVAKSCVAVVAVQSSTASTCATVTLELEARCHGMKDKHQLALAKAYVYTYVETRRSRSAIKMIHILSLVQPHKLHFVGIMVSQQHDSRWNVAGKTARHYSWCLSEARV